MHGLVQVAGAVEVGERRIAVLPVQAMPRWIQIISDGVATRRLLKHMEVVDGLVVVERVVEVLAVGDRRITFLLVQVMPTRMQIIVGGEVAREVLKEEVVDGLAVVVVQVAEVVAVGG